AAAVPPSRTTSAAAWIHLEKLIIYQLLLGNRVARSPTTLTGGAFVRSIAHRQVWWHAGIFLDAPPDPAGSPSPGPPPPAINLFEETKNVYIDRVGKGKCILAAAGDILGRSAD